MMSANTTQYQSEIDGLRGIAISAVVLFHLDVTWVSHGYLGVDMFFVLSGFLISRMLERQMHQGTFSFSAFYLRRFRRLFPTYIFTILLTLGLFSLVFPQGRFLALGESALYSVLHLSNFFWAYSGSHYFSVGAEAFRPLLHLWSLSLEEQFYLVWPAVFLLVLKLRKPWFWGLFLLALMALSYWQVGFLNVENTRTKFFLPHIRFFEFVIGALTWQVSKRLNAVENVYKESLLILGLLLLVAQFNGVLSEWLSYSSFIAMATIVCFATSFCIVGSGASLARRFLSFKPTVGLGLISYSLYLLHWPLITFYRFVTYKGQLVSVLEQVLLMLICLLAGALCFRFVEQPFRHPASHQSLAPATSHKKNRPFLSQPRAFCTLSVLLTLLVAGVSKLAHQGAFENWRFSDELTRPIKMKHAISQCGRKKFEVLDGCKFLFGATSEIDVLVLGDSHLIRLQPVFKKLSKKEKLNVEVRYSIGCAPFLGGTMLKQGLMDKKCSSDQQSRINQIEKLNPKVVILVASWSSYLESFTSYGVLKQSPVGIHYKQHPHWTPRQAFAQAMMDTTWIISNGNRQVILFSPIPTLAGLPRDCFRLPSVFSGFIDAQERCMPSQSLDKVLDYQRNIQLLIEQISAPSADVDYIHLGQYLCNPVTHVCPLLDPQGRSLYRDYNHLSQTGRKYIQARLIAELQEVLNLK